MNKGLKKFLDDVGAEPLDEETLRKYDRMMTEQVIPEAEKDLRANDERIAELRYSSNPTSRRRRNASEQNGTQEQQTGERS